jgi:salicylate hydroxylase
MLPYIAQGANSSLENGATIGALISKVKRKNKIRQCMTPSDDLKPIKSFRRHSRRAKEHHLPEGPEQVKRDMLLAKSFEKSTNGEKTWYVSPIDADYREC